MPDSAEVSPPSSQKVVTVRQPYCELIASRRKPLEIRSWPTKHRGVLYIHAALHPHLNDVQAGTYGLNAGELLYGAIIAKARLAEVREYRPEDQAAAHVSWYAPGHYAWVLQDVERLEEAIYCKGQQGLWNPPPGVPA